MRDMLSNARNIILTRWGDHTIYCFSRDGLGILHVATYGAFRSFHVTPPNSGELKAGSAVLLEAALATSCSGPHDRIPVDQRAKFEERLDTIYFFLASYFNIDLTVDAARRNVLVREIDGSFFPCVIDFGRASFLLMCWRICAEYCANATAVHSQTQALTSFWLSTRRIGSRESERIRTVSGVRSRTATKPSTNTDGGD